MINNRYWKMIYIPMFIVLSLSASGCRSGAVPSVTVHMGTGGEPATEDASPQPEEASEPASEQHAELSGTNLIPGGDFAESDSSWGLYSESGGSASFKLAQGKLQLRITDPGKVGHAVQLYCGGFELLQGAKYAFSAEISSDVSRSIEWRIQLNGGDYHPYIDIEDEEIGPESKELYALFTMEEASDPSPRLCFNVGDADRAQGLGEHTIYLDNVKLVIIDDTNAKKVENMGELLPVNINQIGYRPGDEKRAVFRSVDGDRSFEVIDADSKKTVYKGEITDGVTFGTSGDRVGYGDFTSFSEPGRYFVKYDGGQSYEFSIADGIYEDALIDTIRMLYLQRCGIALPEELAGDFAHSACHTEEAKIYGGEGVLEVSGGWHDAGDYGRYTGPGAKAAADLMLAYEIYPDSFTDSLNIPESGNGVPDILNEAKYELDWLFKMQASDGGVYHKVTGLNFDGFVKADECTEELYVLPVSKTSTADFAGVMYMAARVFKDIDPEYAGKCEKAADRALAAYIERINEKNYTNPEDVLTGEYGDGCSVDEFLWAICEGYKTTQDPKFEKMLATVDFERIINDGFGWDDMSGYAFYAYLSSEKQMKSDFDFRKRFFDMCNELKDTAISGEAYGCTIVDEYVWGSNMIVANNGMALLMAHSLTGDDDYLLAAKRQLDYLFGTNTNSYCFLTGYGTQAPVAPHHRPSQAIGKCMKGMLVGGPDSRLEDPYAKAVLAGLPKARCYTDNAQSYSCNEITIYWNSPLAFLIAPFR